MALYVLAFTLSVGTLLTFEERSDIERHGACWRAFLLSMSYRHASAYRRREGRNHLGRKKDETYICFGRGKFSVVARKAGALWRRRTYEKSVHRLNIAVIAR